MLLSATQLRRPRLRFSAACAPCAAGARHRVLLLCAACAPCAAGADDVYLIAVGIVPGVGRWWCLGLPMASVMVLESRPLAASEQRHNKGLNVLF